MVQANVLELKPPLDGINDIGLGALNGGKLQAIQTSFVGKLQEVSSPKKKATIAGSRRSDKLMCPQGGFLGKMSFLIEPDSSPLLGADSGRGAE